MSYRHQLRIRYSECDQQGVVFNANYMMYMDDATDVWICSLLPDEKHANPTWEWMLVRASVNWMAPARSGDLLNIDVAIVRYGNLSFDFGFRGFVDEELIFTGRTVCVSVRPGTLEKTAIPDHVRPLLGEATDWDIPA